MNLRFTQIDVFTSVPLQGNPAAVVFGAGRAPTPVLQAIAREMNLSETVFLSEPVHAEADYRARIFTPRNELPFAGHPTIAAAYAVLDERGGGSTAPLVLHQECGVGVIPIHVEPTEVGPFFRVTQAPPEWFEARITREQCASMLGCRYGDLPDLPLQVISTGVRWLIVPLASVDVVAALRPDFIAIQEGCRSIGAVGVTAFCLRGATYREGVRLRSFAPGEGVLEDPVCGSGNGSVAAYVARFLSRGARTLEYTAEQGAEAGRPGRVSVRALRGTDDAWSIQVGGHAVRVMEGTILLPD
ncbi:trans-2,3-dihydro-3-hydroxyanthranilate isomerase [bacterium BMS3Bbin12]|nr:trans-2,3-dihydro-3-hydroxyanthranilate isomerase [bacterium BMS3Abin12]GBE49091.1 trans-2,3-dihydro-3-hydroxyanthranilate isomerase [bacterium BMS3Bbin12]GBE50850.1 trans-2,3-dihydro-3-hydroxyanthranilate isomerase [bacterium BMS3Bbin13]HDJ86372.1 PhzF family phenazine biosynthesis protein [Chromatiales bacterium]HDO33868.1 PhzF family phenazine biosynthesis protein [Chromatiales bacterium]